MLSFASAAAAWSNVVASAAHPAPGSPSGRGAHTGELDPRLLAGEVERRQRGAGEARRIGVDREARDAVLTGGALEARHDHEEVGEHAVEHVRLRAVERPAVAARAPRDRADALGVPAAAGLGDCERRDRLARRDAREDGGLLVGGARVHDRTGGQHHAREVGRAQQHATHLLEHDAELDEREALPAVRLGEMEALQAELLGHLLPHRGVVSLVGLHEPADLGRRRLRREEAAHRVAQLVLFLRERESHPVAPGVGTAHGARGASIGCER